MKLLTDRQTDRQTDEKLIIDQGADLLMKPESNEARPRPNGVRPRTRPKSKNSCEGEAKNHEAEAKR